MGPTPHVRQGINALGVCIIFIYIYIERERERAREREREREAYKSEKANKKKIRDNSMKVNSS